MRSRTEFSHGKPNTGSHSDRWLYKGARTPPLYETPDNPDLGEAPSCGADLYHRSPLASLPLSGSSRAITRNQTMNCFYVNTATLGGEAQSRSHYTWWVNIAVCARVRVRACGWRRIIGWSARILWRQLLPIQWTGNSGIWGDIVLLLWFIQFYRSLLDQWRIT